jgi:very-short-patch-repair endonuclease
MTDYRTLMALAAAQHGVLLRTQVLTLGFTDRVIERHLREGLWDRVATGLYAVAGSPCDERQTLHGACLLHNGVASHASAGRLWALPTKLDLPLRPEVTVRRGATHSSTLAVVHETAHLDPEDVTEQDGIPCTTVSRTVLDLAGRLAPHHLSRLVEDLWLDDRLDPEGLQCRLSSWARRGRRGTKVLRRILEDRFGLPLVDSELEARFVELVRSAGLPEPDRQVVQRLSDGQFVRIDFSWCAGRVVVEVDGRRWHARSTTMSSDRKRDNDHTLAGRVSLRFTWEHVVREPAYVRAALERALLAVAA